MNAIKREKCLMCKYNVFIIITSICIAKLIGLCSYKIKELEIYVDQFMRQLHTLLHKVII